MGSTTTVSGSQGNTGIRVCCILSPSQSIGFAEDENANMSVYEHKSNTHHDLQGIIYTVAAGFIDLGHLRDLADQTYYCYQQIITPKPQFKPMHYGGTIKILKEIPTDNLTTVINIAKNIAYVESVFHEIESYWVDLPGFHNSSFSPEDLTSNWLGTYVGGKAIEASKQSGEDFDTSVTKALVQLFGNLGAVSQEETQQAFTYIQGKWIKELDPFISFIPKYVNVKYLRRRNFTGAIPGSSITPWVLQDFNQTLSVQTSMPTDLSFQIPSDALEYYSAEFDVEPLRLYRPSPFFGNLKIDTEKLKLSQFDAEITKIKGHAQSKYGADYDKP